MFEPEFYSVKTPSMIKDPTTYSMLTYIWVSLLSAWGGVVRYLNSIKDKDVPLRKIFCELAISSSTSVFVGIITFFLCEAADFAPLWTAVCVAMTGHMGAESLSILRAIVKRRLGASSDSALERKP